MSSELFVNKITGTSGTSGGAPITLSGDTATLGSGVAMAANHSGVKTALNASGTAPIYACRAWANFNQATVNAQGNISGVTDNGTGNYTVSFTNNMPDTNYSAVLTAETSGGYNVATHTKAVGSFIVSATYENAGPYDTPLSLVVVR